MPVSIYYVSTNDASIHEKSFLRKIRDRINRKTEKKIVLRYGIWILNLEVVVFPSKFKILNLEVVVFPLNFWNTTIIWQHFLYKSINFEFF